MSGCPSTVRGGLKLLSFGRAHSWNLTGASGHPPALGGGAPCAKVRSAAAARTIIAAAQAGMSDGFTGDLRQGVRMKTNSGDHTPESATRLRPSTLRFFEYGTEHDAMGGFLDRRTAVFPADRDRQVAAVPRVREAILRSKATPRALHTARRDGDNGRGLPGVAEGDGTLS